MTGTQAIATAGFHVYDPEQGLNVFFRPGDIVPDHIAENVGDHAISRDGKAKAEAAAKENADAASKPAETSKPAGKPGLTVTTNADPVEFNPDDHKVDEVLTYLETADPAESERVRDLERKGQARKGILGDE